jgi:hypothetical protein
VKTLSTEIEIAAPPERIWSVLTDLDGFAAWNPFIIEAEGTVREGARLRIRMKPPGGRAVTFRPTVMRVVPSREFHWLGHLLFPGLFDGRHIFELIPLEDHRVRFVQREEFHGILVPLLWGSLERQTRQGFHDMNEALKARAEAGSPT